MYKIDQKGVSLPLVLIISALVTANVYYFLAVDKKSKVENLRTSARLNEQAEMKRIVSYLASSNTCEANFANNTAPSSAATSADLLNSGTPFRTALLDSKGGTAFLQNGQLTVGTSHRVNKFYMMQDPSIADLKLQYYLVVEYVHPNVAGNVTAKTLNKTTTVIRIPMFIEFASGKVSKCYARPDTANATQDLETAVQQSCLGAGAWFTDGSSYKICLSSFNYSTPFPTLNGGQVLAGLSDTSSTQTTVDFQAGSLNTNCTPSNQQGFALRVNASVVMCQMPDLCPAGSMMIRNTNSISCSSACGVNQLMSGMNPNGTPKCEDRLKLCGAGLYAREVYPDGTADCQPILFKGKSCLANQYVVDINPLDTVNPLTCASYSRVKSCPPIGWPNSRFRFVSGLYTSPTMPCMDYTN